MDAEPKYQSRSREEKNILMEKWNRSGKSKKEFAKENDLSYQSFISWFDRKEKSVSENQFIALEIKKESRTGIFAEIDLGKGRRIVFHQPVGAEYFHQLLK